MAQDDFEAQLGAVETQRKAASVAPAPSQADADFESQLNAVSPAQTQAPAIPENTATPNPWWYAAGRALTGLMGGSDTPAYIPGVMVDPRLYSAPTATPQAANQMVFGQQN